MISSPGEVLTHLTAAAQALSRAFEANGDIAAAPAIARAAAATAGAIEHAIDSNSAAGGTPLARCAPNHEGFELGEAGA